MENSVKFVDLFAGMGGTRIGFEQFCKLSGIVPECVFTSEIKLPARKIYRENFPGLIHGDITQIANNSIPTFDYLLAGFPCQAFSSAGKREGFEDTRGTLFFEILRILKAKMPTGFLLENVPGLVTHDLRSKGDKIGNTLQVILNALKSLGYNVNWKVIDSSNFGVPQKRKRIYILGHLEHFPILDNFSTEKVPLEAILDYGQPSLDTPFTKKLLTHFDSEDLHGKAIKDKRGGPSNIHSWDIGLKGSATDDQKTLLKRLLTKRRQKHWAINKGIDWMDGMPLTLGEIHTFCQEMHIDSLQEQLDGLVAMGYLSYEHPKQIVRNGNGVSRRESDPNIPAGYNIVTGKLSFEITKILDPNLPTNTLVASETDRLAVVDGKGVRRLTQRECLRLFGYPENYRTSVKDKDLYDLIGNTVVIPVIKELTGRLLKTIS